MILVQMCTIAVRISFSLHQSKFAQSETRNGMVTLEEVRVIS